MSDVFDFIRKNNVIEHWKELTEENLEKQEVGEIVCRIGDNYKLMRVEIPSVVECKSKGGEPIVFFHNHPSRYEGISWGEPKLSYGDIGWGIANKVRCMCVGADTEKGINVKCFCHNLSDRNVELLAKKLLLTENHREYVDVIDMENPYKEVEI